jgi:nucleoside-triphosphatase THEP1
MSDLEFNPQFQQAQAALLNTKQHVFITGRAGTGKSTLLKHFLTQITDERSWVVVAPTGVAALNVGGETIHHFFRLKPAATIIEVVREAKKARRDFRAEIYQHLQILIIDEISMVRADLFDSIDIFLQKVRGNQQPFGGVRVICFGDLYQLPPVVRSSEKEIFQQYYDSPYFFSSHVFQRLQVEESLNNFCFIELEKIYRQTDPTFINFLNDVRTRDVSDSDLTLINNQVLEIERLSDLDSRYVILTTTRAKAHAINLARLQELSTPTSTFIARSSHNFRDSAEPTDQTLELKVGARVMLLVNDSQGRYVNGSLGAVGAINDEQELVSVQLDTGLKVEVNYYTWESSRSVYNQAQKRIERETIGSFSQLPLKLAWAMTIHKAQGKTFPHLMIDLERHTFTTGQAYVALSRGVDLSGICLARPLRLSDIRLDYKIVKFLTNIQYQLAAKQRGGQNITDQLETAIASGSSLIMDYLKANNTKSQRIIQPIAISDMEFKGVKFLGLTAICSQYDQQRTFNVARILKLDPITPPKLTQPDSSPDSKPDIN